MKDWLQAMYCGLPSVLSDIESFREAVGESKCAFLVPLTDKDGMVKKISLLACNLKHRKQMGKAAAFRVEENFDIESVADQYEELL